MLQDSSLSFITQTALVSETTGQERAEDTGARTLHVLGYDTVSRRICMLEHYQGVEDRVPQLYTIRAYGLFAGRMTAASGWPTGDMRENAREVGSRLAKLEDRLAPLFPVDARQFHMSARVVKRRAVRMEPNTTPIRKYDVRVTVRPMPHGRIVPMGARKTVTTYLQPRVRMEQVLVNPRLDFAVAVVSYIGVPHEIGYDRQTAVYLPLPAGLCQLV